MNEGTQVRTAEAGLSQLLYWYVWPFWMFKDVNRGSARERIAAYRHNRARRVFLPPYLVKWSFIFLGFLGAVAVFDPHGDFSAVGTLLAGGAGVLAAWALVVMMMITVTWLGLSCWEHPGCR